MKKINSFFIILFSTSFTVSAWSQHFTSTELEIGFTNSIFMKNKFAGTGSTYESVGQYSNLNLKCTNIAGVQFGYSNSIGKSNWILFGGFEKKWIQYQQTIFQANFNPDSEKNRKEIVQLKNQLNNFKLGIGYKLSFFKSKIFIKPYFNILYRVYRDEEVFKQRNRPVNNWEVGDNSYEIDLNTANYHKTFASEIGINLSYSASKKMKIFANFNISSPLQVYYFTAYLELTSKEYYPDLGIIWFNSSGSSGGGWRIKTNNSNIGFGIQYAIGSKEAE